VTLKGPKNLIPPRSRALSTTPLPRPKDYELLKTQGIGLEYAIDSATAQVAGHAMLVTLKFLYRYVQNYGIAIILLTILIKAIFWPLGNKSYRSMKRCRSSSRRSPPCARIQGRQVADQQESIALYKAHKVNPLADASR